MTRSLRQLRAGLSFFSPVKFLSAWCAREGDSEDKEIASCVVSLQETEPPAEDVSPGRGFLIVERIRPGCRFASGSLGPLPDPRGSSSVNWG